MGDLAALEELAEAVVDSGRPLSPAELHGTVCGFAVFPAQYFPYYELADLLDPGIAGDDPALVRFVEAVREDLVDQELGFMLLLPDDETSLEDRLAALGMWCGGFLGAFGCGLGLGAEATDADDAGFALPDELQEIIDDLAAIAEVEPQSVEDLEEDDEDPEAQFVELEEFVRISVLLIMSVLARGNADPDD